MSARWRPMNRPKRQHAEINSRINLLSLWGTCRVVECSANLPCTDRRQEHGLGLYSALEAEKLSVLIHILCAAACRTSGRLLLLCIGMWQVSVQGGEKARRGIDEPAGSDITELLLGGRAAFGWVQACLREIIRRISGVDGYPLWRAVRRWCR